MSTTSPPTSPPFMVFDPLSPCSLRSLRLTRAPTTALEQEINDRAYRLYGLTPEEIKLVEAAGK